MDDCLPCGSCRQPVELGATYCPHCDADLRVDVILQRPPHDARVRYQLMKSVGALPGAPPVTAVQRSLAETPPVLARAVTRAFAHAAVAILAQNGVRGSIEKHVEEQGVGSKLTPKRVLAGVAVVVVLGGVLAGWQLVVKRLAPRELRLTANDVPLPGHGKPGTPQQPAGAGAAKPAAASTEAAEAKSPRELARAGLAAAAALRCSNSSGSGFFVTEDLLVTNEHVLCSGSDAMQVRLSDNRTLIGRVKRRSSKHDLALVQVTGANAQALPLGDTGELEVGDRVTIVGSPIGLDFSVQEGSISNLQRSTSGVAYVQLDAKISPGNSGGPVIDGRGRVVAVVARKMVGEAVEGIGLALPINYIYSAGLDFVPPPTPAARSSAAFAQMVASAEAGRGDMGPEGSGGPGGPPGGDVPAVDNRPLLVGADVDQYERLVIRVVRVTGWEPGYQEVAVKLWSGTEMFCTIKGDISSWKQADARTATFGLDARTAAGLARLAQGRTLFVGESALRWDLCEHAKLFRGFDLVLEDAHPSADRIQVRWR